MGRVREGDYGVAAVFVGYESGATAGGRFLFPGGFDFDNACSLLM